MKKTIATLFCVVASMAMVIALSSCSSEKDPTDNPGYYKGPMKPKSSAGDAGGGQGAL